MAFPVDLFVTMQHFFPLAHIVNLSIIQGSVPVIPLYYRNDKTEVGNFRTISIVCTLSKIFERVIYNQIEGHLL